MGFGSVYRSLTDIYPQIDARILRAVAIEHPKDADEAAAVVLSEILPSLTLSSNLNFTQSSKKSSGSISEQEVERDLEDVVSRCRNFLEASGSKSSFSSSSVAIPLVVACGNETSTQGSDLVSSVNEPPNIVRDGCHKDILSKEVQSMKRTREREEERYDIMSRCFDVSSKAKPGLHMHVPEDDVASVVSADAQENINLTIDQWQDLGYHMKFNQTESAVQKLVDVAPGDNMTNTQQGSCFEVGSVSRNVLDETSEGSLACENGDTSSTTTHVCSVDHLEAIIEDAKSNKKTLLIVMESVTNLMKEVELQEKDAEKAKEEAVSGGLDTLEKVEELKKMLEHAKEANNMHAGEVYGEKSILATEVKELQNRLLNLSEERNKSLAVLDEMRETLEIRLAAAVETKMAAEKEKKEKEDSALKALTDQEAIMEKVVQESKLLQQEAEENSKLREFLMSRGQIVDSLQGEISVICQDVKLLKEKFNNRVPLTKSISSSQTSTPSLRSILLENPFEQWNGELETSSNYKIAETAASSMSKDANYTKELLEDGWDMFN